MLLSVYNGTKTQSGFMKKYFYVPLLQSLRNIFNLQGKL